MTFLEFVGLAAIVCAALAFVRWAWQHRPRRTPAPSPRTPTRTEPCRTCHDPVAVDVAHRVVATFDDDAEGEMFGGGGTAMVAEYHPACCPGGCVVGCCAPDGHDWSTYIEVAERLAPVGYQCATCGRIEMEPGWSLRGKKVVRA